MISFVNPLKNNIILSTELDYSLPPTTISTPLDSSLSKESQNLGKQGEKDEIKDDDKVKIVENHSEGIFSLKYNQNKKLSLRPGQRVSVTVSYLPMEIREYRCSLVLRLSDKL